jgi:hypothetical protein
MSAGNEGQNYSNMTFKRSGSQSKKDYNFEARHKELQLQFSMKEGTLTPQSNRL